MSQPKAQMSTQETIEMMRRCSAEIKELRARIAVLEPKAHAYDSMAQILGLLPRPPQGYAEDVAWLLDKRIRELEGGKKPTEGEAA